jgi:hypothetical protein
VKTPAEKAKLKGKVAKVIDAIPGSGVEGMAAMTRFGEVQFASIKKATDAEGAELVEVYLQGETVTGEAHFRIYNPPLLTEDPTGPIEIGGRHYREDPVAAIAEVIARTGGAKKGGRRR